MYLYILYIKLSHKDFRIELKSWFSKCVILWLFPILEPRLSVPDFVSQLTKSGTESLGLKLAVPHN